MKDFGAQRQSYVVTNADDRILETKAPGFARGLRFETFYATK